MPDQEVVNQRSWEAPLLYL